MMPKKFWKAHWSPPTFASFKNYLFQCKTRTHVPLLLGLWEIRPTAKQWEVTWNVEDFLSNYVLSKEKRRLKISSLKILVLTITTMYFKSKKNYKNCITCRTCKFSQIYKLIFKRSQTAGNNNFCFSALFFSCWIQHFFWEWRFVLAVHFMEKHFQMKNIQN